MGAKLAVLRSCARLSSMLRCFVSMRRPRFKPWIANEGNPEKFWVEYGHRWIRGRLQERKPSR
jgi:hypothetical protein